MVSRVDLSPIPFYDRAHPRFPMVPFSLVDRPNHLRVLRHMDLYREHPGQPLGIMTHANVTLPVQALVRDFPCGTEACIDVTGAPCPYRAGPARCPFHRYIRQRAIIMCDSGVFTKQGATLAYPDLFALYARMDIDYGLMIDVVHNRTWADSKWYLFQHPRTPVRLTEQMLPIERG